MVQDFRPDPICQCAWVRYPSTKLLVFFVSLSSSTRDPSIHDIDTKVSLLCWDALQSRFIEGTVSSFRNGLKHTVRRGNVLRSSNSLHRGIISIVREDSVRNNIREYKRSVLSRAKRATSEQKRSDGGVFVRAKTV